MPEINSEHQQRWSRFIEARQKLIASLERPIYTKGKSTEDDPDPIVEQSKWGKKGQRSI